MMTSRDCEIAYYVMWSVLLKARQDVQRKITEARKNGHMPDPKVLQTEASIAAMSKVTGTGDATAAINEVGEQSHAEHMEIEEIIKRMEEKVDRIKEGINAVKAKMGPSPGPSPLPPKWPRPPGGPVAKTGGYPDNKTRKNRSPKKNKTHKNSR
jgi:hypothetical protein